MIKIHREGCPATSVYNSIHLVNSFLILSGRFFFVFSKLPRIRHHARVYVELYMQRSGWVQQKPVSVFVRINFSICDIQPNLDYTQRYTRTQIVVASLSNEKIGAWLNKMKIQLSPPQCPSDSGVFRPQNHTINCSILVNAFRVKNNLPTSVILKRQWWSGRTVELFDEPQYNSQL